MIIRGRVYQRISSLNFSKLLDNKSHLFEDLDKETIRTLRFNPEKLQKRDLLVSGWLREQNEMYDDLYFPAIIASLILLRLPSFKPNDEVKLVIGGYTYVGKSSLIKQFIDKSFKHNYYHATVGVDYHTNRYVHKLMDKEIRLNICDLSGNPKYKNSLKIQYKNCDLTMVVFDITNKKSFEYALDLIDNYIDNTSTVALIGNKLDLEDKREINKIKAINAAEEKGCFYFEVSAIERDGVEAMFERIINMVMYRFPPDIKFVR